jgi:hypothetical protein
MTDTAAPAPAEQANIEAIIAKYITLRAEVDKRTNALKAELKPLNEAMEAIETYFLALINTTGQTQFGTSVGTAFKTTKTGCNIENKSEFLAHLKKEDAWHLLTLSANKTAVGEYIDQHNVAPPGIKWTAITAVQIRKK